MGDYIIYIIIFASALLLYILVSYFINLNKNKLIYDEIEAFCMKNNFTYEKVSSLPYDIIISNNKFVMYVAICKIPSNSSVTINSRDTWVLRFGGGKRKGRNYPNQRYLNELVKFLRSNVTSPDETLQTIRAVVLYPKTEVVLKYVNESDIIEVKPKDTSYGFKVINYSDFFDKFSDLLLVSKK